MNIAKMIEIKQKYEISILSPKVLQSTHSFMNENTDLTIHNALEVYCLLLKPADIKRFFSIHSIENKCMWGVDFLFGFYGIKAGVLSTCVVSHELPRGDHRTDAHSLMIDYFIKHTPFKSLHEIVNVYPQVIYKLKIEE
jgi:hypothetical protein